MPIRHRCSFSLQAVPTLRSKNGASVSFLGAVTVARTLTITGRNYDRSKAINFSRHISLISHRSNNTLCRRNSICQSLGRIFYKSFPSWSQPSYTSCTCFFRTVCSSVLGVGQKTCLSESDSCIQCTVKRWKRVKKA